MSIFKKKTMKTPIYKASDLPTANYNTADATLNASHAEFRVATPFPCNYVMPWCREDYDDSKTFLDNVAHFYKDSRFDAMHYILDPGLYRRCALLSKEELDLISKKKTEYVAYIKKGDRTTRPLFISLSMAKESYGFCETLDPCVFEWFSLPYTDVHFAGTLASSKKPLDTLDRFIDPGFIGIDIGGLAAISEAEDAVEYSKQRMRARGIEFY